MDRREDITDSLLLSEKYFHDDDIRMEFVHDAMDEYMKASCLELLEYMAKNKIELDIVNGEVQCYLRNGEGISKESLFENFL